MNTYRITIKLRVKPTNKRKRVAILGAGPAGLVSAKYAAENGMIPVVFDRKSIPGGLWASGSAIWDGMHTNVSKYSVMFSDFPWPEGTSVIPSAKDVYQYLVDYIKHYDLNKYLRLNSNIESVRQLPNKKWQVTWTNYLNGERITEIYDYLICATGLHCKPSVPKIENSEKYKGLILHSADYRSQDQRLKNKRIIVVGNSYSGVEIASHLVGHAHSVVNIFNRPYLVFPRLLKIRSANKNEKNTFHIIPIDLLFGRELTFSNKSKEEERKAKIELYNQLCPHQTNKQKCHPAMYYELDNDEPIREAVTDNYYPYIKSGKIIPRKARIKRFDKHGLQLEDGSVEPADAIIFCTGYRLCLDYFEPSVLKTLKFDPSKEKMPILLYKYTVHPELENMAMVGEINGLFFAGFELQAKWAIKLFKGEKQLPPRDIVDYEMRLDEQTREKSLNNQYPHGVYNELIDKLAYEVDALPDFVEVAKKSPKVFDMLWKNGTVPSHFCFNTNRELSIKIMREVDEIISKKYKFTDEELEDVTTQILANKFSRNFRIPLHLFKD